MKIYSFMLFMLIFFGLSSVSKAQNDETLLKETLSNYLDGGTDGDTARFAKAFIPQAIQRTVSKEGKISQMSVKELVGKITPNQKLNRTTKIISWSFANLAATAVTQSDFETFNYVDLLNLLKINGQWKIVSRVFTRTEKGMDIVSSNPVVKGAVSSPMGGSAGGSASNVKPSSAKKTSTSKPKSDDGW